MRLLSSLAILFCFICSNGFAKHEIHHKEKKSVWNSPYERFLPYIVDFFKREKPTLFEDEATSADLLSEWEGFLEWNIDDKNNSVVIELDPYDFYPSEEGFEYGETPFAHISGSTIFSFSEPIIIFDLKTGKAIFVDKAHSSSNCKLFLDPLDRNEEILLCYHDILVESFFHLYRHKQPPQKPNT